MSYDELMQWLLAFCNDAEIIEYKARQLEGNIDDPEQVNINEVIAASYWVEDQLFATT